MGPAHCPRRRSALLLACLLGIAWGHAAAGDSGAHAAVDIQAVLGFSDTFRAGRWTPLTVTVANRGPALTGRLEVETTDGDEFRRKLYPIVHERPLELGRDARKRFHFTVYLETVSRPVVVRVRAAGHEVAVRRIDLRPRFTAERLVLVLSRDADLDYLNDRDGEGLRVLYAHPDLLPRAWQGYDAVAAVVLHGLSLESLQPEQYEALSRWIARGGTLAVSGGPEYAVLRTPRLAALLPAMPTGMRPVTDPATVGAALGAPLTAVGTFHVDRVSRVTGRVVREADGVPLVLESRHGLGRVLYLTFDVAREPFDRWSPMKDLWNRLLDLEHTAPAPIHAPDDPSPVPALLGTDAPGFPGHGTLLIFLALYLALLATTYRLRAGIRPTRRWPRLVGWCVPLLFTPGAYALFGPYLFERGAAAVTVAVIEPLPGSPYARLRLDLGIHTNRRGGLRLAYEGVDPVFRAPFEARRVDAGKGWRFGEEPVLTLAPGDRRPYVLSLLEGHDVIPFDLEAAIPDPRHPRLSLRNGSGQALHGAWLVHEGAAWFLGTVAAGAVLEEDLDRAPDVLASDRDEWWEALARDPRGPARQLRVISMLLAHKADGRDERRYPGTGHALLLGFTSSPLRIASDAGDWRRTDLTLVLLRFPALLPSRGPTPQGAERETT